ncbi:MAG: FG-GAP repeat domain-containing protein [Planctomycetota bacterium]
MEQRNSHRSPEWTPHPVAQKLVLHDIEVADFDGDGDVDIVGRNQNWSEKTSGAALFIMRQEAPDRWTRATVRIPEGEGLVAADIDGDKDLDFVVNSVWVENRGDLLADMPIHDFGPEWKHAATFVATGDLNADGRTDIVLSPSEKAGTRYRLSWFEAPADPKGGRWTEHVVDADVETAHHFVGVADFNLDGLADIATAAMGHAAAPQNVTLFLNPGEGRDWVEQVIGSNGSHSMRIVDLDGTGAPSLFGANYRSSKVELWRNVTPRSSL